MTRYIIIAILVVILCSAENSMQFKNTGNGEIHGRTENMHVNSASFSGVHRTHMERRLPRESSRFGHKIVRKVGVSMENTTHGETVKLVMPLSNSTEPKQASPDNPTTETIPKNMTKTTTVAVEGGGNVTVTVQDYNNATTNHNGIETTNLTNKTKSKEYLSKMVITNHTSNETTNHTSNETTHHTTKEITNHTLKEATNHTSKETTNNTSNETINHISKEPTNHTSKETTNHATTESSKHTTTETTKKRTHARKGVNFTDILERQNTTTHPVSLISSTSSPPLVSVASNINVSLTKKPKFTMVVNDKETDESDSFIESSTTGKDYVFPIVLAILIFPVLLIVIKLIYKRGTEFTERQHYHRMYLIDGMYNSR